MIIPGSELSESFDISFDYRPEYLYVYVSGERDSYEISRRYWQMVAGEKGARVVGTVADMANKEYARFAGGRKGDLEPDDEP